MSAPDLHPEELLDKAAAGTLSDSERAWLEQHLAQCKVCRFEHAARVDFVVATSPVADVQVDDLVARALAGMPTREPARARRGGLPWMAAALVATFALGSFAAVWSGVVSLSPVGERAGVRGAASTPLRLESRPKPQVEEAPQPEPVVVPEPPPPPAEAAPSPPPARRSVRRPLTPTLSPTGERELDAPSLFAAGNAARIRGDRAEAALRYEALLREFPSSDEARLTHATLGRMLLDSGDAKGALEQLDAYLSLGDETLREEAMSARARSLALLGRTGEEAAAWQALLQQYPDSVHAERASARLRELGAR